MLDQDYLSLRQVRLKPSEEWNDRRQGLTFVFPRSGEGRYASRAVAHRIRPGDVLVINVESGGRLFVPVGGELGFSCFSVCFEHLFPLLASSEIPLLQDVTESFSSARLYPASGTVAAECHRLLEDVPLEFDLGHRGQLLRVVTAILTQEFHQAHRQRVGFVRAEERVVQVFEKLSLDEVLTCPVSELAAKFGCTRRHLNRLFHQYFGVSVASLRMEMRLLKAVSLLRNPNAKVINVAEECGFNHLGLFNTCFKRRFGTSPGRRRKMALPLDTPNAGMSIGAAGCPLHLYGLCPWWGKVGDQTPATPSPAPVQEAALANSFANPKRQEAVPGYQP